MTDQKAFTVILKTSWSTIYPQIAVDVDKDAKKQWSAFTKKNSGKSVVELLEQLANH